MTQPLWKSSLAELLGTFTLVFVGALAVTVAGDQGLVVAALGHGLVLIGIIYTFDNVSGAQVNPAVTLGLMLGGHIAVVRGIAHIVAQLIGGVLAGFLVAALVPAEAGLGETIGTLTASNPFGTLVLEAVLTFILVSVVYQAAVHGHAGALAGVAIGLTLAGCIFAGGVYTGASLNPARTLGPALAAGNLAYVLPYIAGPIAGALLAGALHAFVLGKDSRHAVATPER